MAEFKGYQPTKKKLRKALKDGKILKSQFLLQSLSVVFGLSTLAAVTHFNLFKNEMLLEYCIRTGMQKPGEIIVYLGTYIFSVLIVSLGMAGIFSTAIGMLVSGMHVTPSLLLPKGSRVDPVAGVRRLVSGVKGLWQSLLRFLLIAAVTFFVFISVFYSLPALPQFDGPVVITFFKKQVGVLLALEGLALLVLGCIELLVNKRNLTNELSMSLDEIRREQKEDEGDPHIRSNRRAVHQEIAMQDLVQRVRKSKVVIVEK